MTQKVLLVILGADGESTGQKALIEEDSTVADLLGAAGFNSSEWQLRIKQGEKYIPLRSEDKLSQFVEDGEKVYVHPAGMVVGLVV